LRAIASRLYKDNEEVLKMGVLPKLNAIHQTIFVRFFDGSEGGDYVFMLRKV